MTPPISVDAYVEALPYPSRATFLGLRAAVRAAAPDAAETISYAIPTLKVDGRLLVSYAAFARHVSLFPASGLVREALGEALAPYLSGKGTIRFTLDEPLPEALIRRVVEIRREELAAARRR